jgi:hypothetical protein
MSEQELNNKIESLKQQLRTERLKVTLLHDAAIIARVALTRDYPTEQHFEAYKDIRRLLGQVANLEQET